MKKSLFITIDFPPQIGGVATYISHVCKNLPKEKIIVFAHTHKNSADYDIQQEYKIIRKDFFPNWYKAFKYTYQIIRKEKIKMLHTSHVLPLGYITLIFKLFLRISYITYLHGYDFKLAYENTWKRFWLKLILRFSQNIIVNSGTTQQLLLDIYPQFSHKTIIVYPCPHDSLHIAESENKITAKYSDKKVLLTISRIVPRKGHELVLQILPNLIKKFPNIMYIIGGTGPHEETLKNLVVKNKLSSHVQFIGAIEQKDIASYYKTADVFVMPNKELGADIEGFGITFLEAALFKKPVIGGANGGALDAVIHGETGFLIRNNSVAELEEYITELLTNTNRANELGMNGYNRCIQEFNWETQTKKIIDLLI